MILIDSRVGSKELAPYIRKYGIPCELADLSYGDAAFEGRGPNGPITIGCERKTLADLLACIDDARYAGHQRPGMLMMYSKSYLCLEGMWTFGDGNGYDGLLMQGYRKGQSWGPLRLKGNRTVLYSKLYRYLMSVSLSGVIITHSHDLAHTAFNLTEMYQWWQKPFEKHHSLIEVQRLAIPAMDGKPSLVRRWASDLEHIGVEKSRDAERIFKSGRALANASEQDWMQIPRVGSKTAVDIVRQVNGWGK